MQRVSQSIFIIATLLTAWLLMQVVHEAGHILAALMTGGTVTRVVLHPLEISRTDVGHNTSPLVVCWGGPLVGVAAPLLCWVVARRLRFAGAFWLQFFAGFCLLANGAYLAVGVREGIGDAGDLLKYGSSAGTLYLFGVATIPSGLLLWHGLGPSFGLGPKGERIGWTATMTVTGLLLSIILAELIGHLWYNH